MLLAKSTWIEIKSYLEKSSTIVISLGSNEQHGPTGLIGTDWMCPEILSNEAARQADLTVATTLTIGLAQQHTGFPAQLHLGTSHAIEVFKDLGRTCSSPSLST